MAMKNFWLIFLAAAGIISTSAQNLSVDWFTLDGGGGQSSDGNLTISGTAGQPDAGIMGDGALMVQGGFWPVLIQGIPMASAPAGYQIYFSVQSATPGSNYIGVVNSDGTGYRHVLDSACWPRLSPDGTKLLYHPVVYTDNFARNNLSLLNLAPSNSYGLYYHGDYLVSYDWQADNTNFLFDLTCGMYGENSQTLQTFTFFQVDCYDDAPSINRQDGRVAFHNSYQGLLLVNSNASGRIRINNTSPGDVWPVWSPDYSKLAFLTANAFSVIQPDGSGRTNLLAKVANAALPVYQGQPFAMLPGWSPDGQWVIAPLVLDGTNGIYALSADGSGVVKSLFVPPNQGDQIVNWIGGVMPIAFYGGENLLLNPGAEAGTLTNWVVGGNSNAGLDQGTFDANIQPRTGAFDFYGGTGASGILSQLVNLQNRAGISLATIDAGNYRAGVSFWEQGLNQSALSDDAYVSLAFLNVNQQVIGSVATPEVDAHNGVWQNYTNQYVLPSGTRYIVYNINFVRHAGGDLDAFVDDASLSLIDVTASSGIPVLSIAPAGGANVTVSWTPATPGFVLQECSDLRLANWSNSASGAINPITVSTAGVAKFYRLMHP